MASRSCGWICRPLCTTESGVVRASTHYYNTPEEVDRLVAAVRRIAVNASNKTIATGGLRTPISNSERDLTMDISDFDGAGLAKFRPARAVVGLDIGSRAAKGILLIKDEVYASTIATGLYMQKTADELLVDLLASSGLNRGDIAYIVGTGYGRISLKYEDIPYQVVTEITCHAIGAHVLNPKTGTIIDIGGQDSKAIKVDPGTGKVVRIRDERQMSRRDWSFLGKGGGGPWTGSRPSGPGCTYRESTGPSEQPVRGLRRIGSHLLTSKRRESRRRFGARQYRRRYPLLSRSKGAKPARAGRHRAGPVVLRRRLQ